LSKDERPQFALQGIKVIDLSRVLAGPWATQLLADLGADVIKVERPGTGDDTRSWGPPWFVAADGAREAAYFTCANRGKRSIAIDIASPAGALLATEMATTADVLVENFKVGALANYGLDYDTLSAINPGLIYCSITGFGQTGPYSELPGYDFVVQAMGGLMSVTGEPGGAPMKSGVALADIMTGLYACSGVLAALLQRQRTGRGQHVTTSLLDVQVATLANQAAGYFATAKNPTRHGNAHPSIVPYQTFKTSDGVIALAVGNDSQFQRLAQVLGHPDLATDERFKTNAGRVVARDALIPELANALQTRPSAHWIKELTEMSVPVGPVNQLSDVFSDPHVQQRGLQIAMPHSALSAVPGIACPVHLSSSPPRNDLGPPTLDEHGAQIRAQSPL
jgi:crotonobetainyl-CoA:carnitine CoA-transferase CaiB-like acyl-CoA transferase